MRLAIDELTANDRIIQLIHDLVVQENVCNLACRYCMTADSRFPKKKIRYKSLEYKSSGPLADNIDSLQKRYQSRFDSPILKLSGGELFLIKDIERYIVEQSHSYEAVQILTNGMLLSPFVLDAMRHRPNIYFQISLDGHRQELNKLRTRCNKQLSQILSNLDELVERGFHTEIFCVLSSQNTAGLPEFCRFLIEKYDGKVGLTCFPVRHSIGAGFLPSLKQLKGLQEVIDHYAYYYESLPPLVYLEDIYTFMATKKRRQLPCHVPYIMMQTFDSGDVTPCPYNWAVNLGNLITDANEVLSNYATHSTYHMRTTRPPWAPFCRYCFTDANILSLYFEDEISMEELNWNRPIYALPGVVERLRLFKTIFRRNQGLR